jgi:hypothetical protein
MKIAGLMVGRSQQAHHSLHPRHCRHRRSMAPKPAWWPTLESWVSRARTYPVPHAPDLPSRWAGDTQTKCTRVLGLRGRRENRYPPLGLDYAAAGCSGRRGEGGPHESAWGGYQGVERGENRMKQDLKRSTLWPPPQQPLKHKSDGSHKWVTTLDVLLFPHVHRVDYAPRHPVAVRRGDPRTMRWAPVRSIRAR